MSIKVSGKTERGLDYIRIRRRADNKTYEAKTRAKLTPKIKRDIESLANDLDTDLALGKLHNRKTLDAVGKLSPDWVKMFRKVNLLGETHQKDYGLFKFLDSRLDHDWERVKAGEIGEATFNKRRYACEHFKCWCMENDIDDIRAISKMHIDGNGGYVLHRKTKAADTTVQSEIKWLRSYFRDAVDLGFIYNSPFENVKVKVNATPVKKRRLIIYQEYLDQLQEYLKEYHYHTWYVYFVICRYTGCRRNEPFKLRWRDINFGKRTLVMPSPKTARLGQDTRIMPLWDELNNILSSVKKEIAGKSKEYVVGGLMNLPNDDRSAVLWDSKNPTTTMNKMCKNAGLTPIRSFFQNLRRTRENQLLQAGTHRPDAIHAFLGHTDAVFASNYLIVNDEDLRPEGSCVPQSVPDMDPNSAVVKSVVKKALKKAIKNATTSDADDGKAPPVGQQLALILREFLTD